MAGGDAETLGVEVWRGGVNTWETDENAHMNVRFYITRALETMPPPEVLPSILSKARPAWSGPRRWPSR
jgi:hypothetical protein